MGFLKGQKVRSVKPAPFKGSIQYEIMGYKISLRKPAVDLIEIIKINPLKDNETGLLSISEESIQKVLERKSKPINIALVSNPNSVFIKR